MVHERYLRMMKRLPARFSIFAVVFVAFSFFGKMPRSRAAVAEDAASWMRESSPVSTGRIAVSSNLRNMRDIYFDGIIGSREPLAPDGFLTFLVIRG
jgi:hypothetical protein